MQIIEINCKILPNFNFAENCHFTENCIKIAILVKTAHKNAENCSCDFP